MDEWVVETHKLPAPCPPTLFETDKNKCEQATRPSPTPSDTSKNKFKQSTVQIIKRLWI